MEKFRELILFICERSEGDPPFGATKLNKLLFFADFVAYAELGAAITAQPYQRLDNGPAPRRIIPMIEEMKARGEVAQRDEVFHGYPQKRTFALREPDLSAFSPQEIALVTQIIDSSWGRNATQMSNLSHDFVGWQIAEPGEDIAYELALVQLQNVSDDELETGREFSDELAMRDRRCLELAKKQGLV